MKELKKVIGCMVLAVAVALFTSSCKKDEPGTVVEIATKQLAEREWSSESVVVDGVAYGDLFKDLSISFKNDTYTSKNGAPVWKEAGTWKFLNEEAKIMVVDDEVEMDVLTLEEHKLVISFQWSIDSVETGRSKSIRGRNTITLIN